MSEISEQLAKMKEIADSALISADQMLTNAGFAATGLASSSSIGRLASELEGVEYPAYPIFSSSGTPDAPELVEPDAEKPELPEIGDYSFDVMAVPDPPNMSYEISMPDAPSGEIPVNTATRPILDIPVAPPVIEITLPDAPSLTELTIPEPPTLELQSFSDGLESRNVDLPSESGFTYSPERYDSTLKQALQDWLVYMVNTGDDGLGAGVEDALFERDRNRMKQEYDDAEQKINANWAGRGFPVPNGMLQSALRKLRFEHFGKRVEQSRDIAVKMAELAQLNRQFAVQQGISLEGILIQNHQVFCELTMRAQKTAFDVSVAVFDANAALRNLELLEYRAKLEQFSMLIQNEQLKLVAYKTQIEAESLKTETNKALMVEYQALVDAQLARIKIYEAQVEAYKARGQIETVKAEMYRMELQAYEAELSATNARFGLYRTQVDGETAKAAVYRSQVEVYGVQVAGFRAQIDANTANLNAQLRSDEARLNRFNFEIAAYMKDLEAAAGINRNLTDIYSAESNVYRSLVDLDVEQARAFSEHDRTLRSIANENVRLKIEAVQAELELFKVGAPIEVKAKIEIAKVYESRAQAALESINAVVQEVHQVIEYATTPTPTPTV